MPPIEVARRYYHDSYATRFQSRVVEALTIDDRPAVVLEETAFYPTSGGQPHDIGTLNGTAVVDVTVRESDQAVVHVLERSLGMGPVEGQIDWGRRLDHMQQHTGQHVLSQAFIRVANAPTIGFHLGADYVSIDLDVTALDDRQRLEAITLANEAITKDLPIRAWFPSAEELGAIVLRKTPDVDGALRIVAIGDFDISACGGTHVARTGEVGLIHWLRTERLKRGTRISFLSGDRARHDYAEKQRIVTAVSGLLTCSIAEVPEAVTRLQADLQATRRELGRHEEAALDREAVELVGAAPKGSPILVKQSWPNRSVEAVRGLALRVTANPGVVALLATSGERTQFVFARSEDQTVNLKPALDAALAAIGGGKGGGSRVVQGGGGPSSPEGAAEALERAAAALGGAR